MDRVEFLHSIGYTADTQVIDIITSFFEQYTALYLLVNNNKPDLNVIDPIYNNSITFEATYPDSKSVEQVNNNILANPYVMIYGSNYMLSGEPKSKKSINITISKT